MDALGKPNWQRRLTDWWQLVREDFLIWRTREANKTKVAITVATIITLLLIWFSWRLWHSRQRKTHSKRLRYRRPKGTPITALHKLEPLIAKNIGRRPEGVPLCRWMLGLSDSHPAIDDQLLRMSELHSKLRFDPAGLPADQTDELTQLAEKLKRYLKRN